LVSYFHTSKYNLFLLIKVSACFIENQCSQHICLSFTCVELERKVLYQSPNKKNLACFFSVMSPKSCKKKKKNEYSKVKSFCSLTHCGYKSVLYLTKIFIINLFPKSFKILVFHFTPSRSSTSVKLIF